MRILLCWWEIDSRKRHFPVNLAANLRWLPCKKLISFHETSIAPQTIPHFHIQIQVEEYIAFPHTGTKSYQSNKLEIQFYQGKHHLSFASATSVDEISDIEDIIELLMIMRRATPRHRSVPGTRQQERKSYTITHWRVWSRQTNSKIGPSKTNSRANSR